MARKRLGDVCEVVTGSTPKTNIQEFWDGNLKWITPAELDENSYIIKDSVRKITEIAVKKTGLTPFPEGTVILSSRAPIGKVAIAGCEMYCNQGFKNLICSDEIYNKYLFWYLRSKTEYLNSLGRGATFKEISKTIVENIELELPILDIQKKAVEKLHKCNEVIQLRRQELQILDTLIKSRFVEMFGDPVLNPFEWKQVTLKDIAVGKLSYGSGASATEYDGECRYVRITDITDNGELNNDIKSPDKYDDKYLLQDGDILFARSGATVGKTFRYSSDKHGKGIYAGYLIRLIPNKEIVMPDYVFYYTKTEYYMSFVKKAQRAVAQPNINAQEYGDLVICVPPIGLQKEFMAFVAQVDKLKSEVQKSLAEAQLLMDSLMQQYFG